MLEFKKKVLCIGGSPCAGKSTVAERISKEYGAYYFKVDDYIHGKKGRNISGLDKVANKVANKVVNKVAKRIGMERTLIMKLVLMRRNSVLSTI